jgi:hypothetical protein
MNETDIPRLKILLTNASERLDKTIADLNQSLIDVASDRTAFFDRLTIGAGAVIAAIVSFLGSHASTLRPEWALRCSLIGLALAIVAGLYRSYRYPYYVTQVRKTEWIEAQLNHQRRRFDLILADGPSVDIHTGEPISKAKIKAECEGSDAKDAAVVEEMVKLRDRLLKECHRAEGVCLAAIGLAMVSLVLLALLTF